MSNPEEAVTTTGSTTPDTSGAVVTPDVDGSEALAATPTSAASGPGINSATALPAAVPTTTALVVNPGPSFTVPGNAVGSFAALVSAGAGPSTTVPGNTVGSSSTLIGASVITGAAICLGLGRDSYIGPNHNISCRVYEEDNQTIWRNADGVEIIGGYIPKQCVWLHNETAEAEDISGNAEKNDLDEEKEGIENEDSSIHGGTHGHGSANDESAINPNSEGLLALPNEILIIIVGMLKPAEVLIVKAVSHRLRAAALATRWGDVVYGSIDSVAQFNVDAAADRDGRSLKKRLPCYDCGYSHHRSKFAVADRVPANHARTCIGAKGTVILIPHVLWFKHHNLRAILSDLAERDLYHGDWISHQELSGDALQPAWMVVDADQMNPPPPEEYFVAQSNRSDAFQHKFPGAAVAFQGKLEVKLAAVTQVEYCYGNWERDELATEVTYELQLVHLVYGLFPTAYYLSADDGIVPNAAEGDFGLVRFLQTNLCSHVKINNACIIKNMRMVICMIMERFNRHPVHVALNSGPPFHKELRCGVCHAHIYIAIGKNWSIEAPTLRIAVRRRLGNDECATNTHWMNSIQPDLEFQT